YAPCYHMTEVYENGDVAAWSAIIDGAPPDWDAMFARYRAVVDWPACAYWKEIRRASPRARVVLTTRDPDAWYQSMAQTILPALRAEHPDPERNGWREHTRRLIFERTFDNDLGRDHAIAVLRAHEADVVASCAPAELLVFDVADGWNPLCAFLDVAVPDTPF